jgi:hypothetical protein
MYVVREPKLATEKSGFDVVEDVITTPVGRRSVAWTQRPGRRRSSNWNIPRE